MEIGKVSLTLYNSFIVSKFKEGSMIIIGLTTVIDDE